MYRVYKVCRVYEIEMITIQFLSFSRDIHTHGVILNKYKSHDRHVMIIFHVCNETWVMGSFQSIKLVLPFFFVLYNSRQISSTMGKISDLLLHPSELFAALEIKFFPSVLYPRDPATESKDIKRSYELLDATSRSFAAVIQQLHPELRDPIAIFYIVLRALDTVEDDMTIPLDTKIPMLRTFDETLYKKDWTFNGSKEKDAIVLEEFDIISRVFRGLKPEYQKVIKDITHRMGNGMADYAIDSDFNRDGLETVKDYDLYCYYVAGLVGEGLTRMAIISEFGSPVLEEKPELHLAMGLFLQKTNIIRDFREDLDDGRTFYPKELWKTHVDSLSELKDPKVAATKGLDVLTEMVINVLELVPSVLEYLDNIEEATLFRFCAIPQVMAVSTLELVFQNVKVFQENVKIRRGLAAKLILNSHDRKGVYDIFRYYVQRIHQRNAPKDPNYLRLEILCGKIEQYIDQHYPRKEKSFSDSPSSAKDAAVKKDDSESVMIIVAAGGVALTTCLIMIGIAYYMGADFSSSGKDSFRWLTDDPDFSAITQTVQTVSTAVSSAVSSVTSAANADL